MNDYDVIVIGAFGSTVNIPNYASAVVTNRSSRQLDLFFDVNL